MDSGYFNPSHVPTTLVIYHHPRMRKWPLTELRSPAMTLVAAIAAYPTSFFVAIINNENIRVVKRI